MTKNYNEYDQQYGDGFEMYTKNHMHSKEARQEGHVSSVPAEVLFELKHARKDI